jgi:hypothetical protein
MMKYPTKSVLSLAAGYLCSILALLITSSMAVSGQIISATSREQVQKLDFLVGEWKGKGWLYRLRDQKSEISQSTKVKIEPDGSALRIKDSKKFREANLLGAPVNFPETIITYDEEAKLYRLRSTSSKGRGNLFEVKLIAPRTFQWVFQTPDGSVRNTIEVTEDGQWHETLELLLSYGWFKSQETFLKRVK